MASASPPLLAGTVRARLGHVRLNCPSPASCSTLPTSDVFVTMWLPRAEPFRLEALFPCFDGRFRFRSDRSARGGRLGRHLIVERCGSYGAPVKERRTGRCNADVFFVSISRRARARRKSFRLHERTVFTSATLSDAMRMDPASLPPRRDLWVSDRLRSFVRLGSGSRSRAILPALSVHDVTRARIPAS